MKNKRVRLFVLLPALMLAACGGENGNSNDARVSSELPSSKEAVSSKEVEKTLSSIEVTARPTKIVYTVGEQLDLTGMVVTATYSDGSKNAVTDFTVDKNGPLELTDTTITVTYLGKTATFKINVRPVAAVVVSSVAITKAPNKVNYHAGERFDPTGMEVTATYSDKSTKVVTDYTIDKTGPLNKGETSITITYSRYSVTQAITVGDAVIASLELTKAPNKTAYLVGETFDPTGMVISGIKTDSTKEVITDYTIDEASRELTLEDTAMVIRKGEFTINVAITVSTAKLIGIEIATAPNKIAYKYGETFDPTGMVVNGKYEDGTSKAITDYTIDKTGALTLDDTVITISFGGFNATVTISVELVVSGLEISAAPTKVNYVAGETFDPTGMEITAVYNDGSRKTINDYTIDKTGALTVKDKVVTISYQGASATVSINVIHGTFNISEPTILRLEAEEANTANLVGDGSGRGYIESYGGASGGQLLGFGTHGTSTWNINLASEMALDMTASICKYEEFVANEQFKMYVDDIRVEMKDKDGKLGGTPTNPWYNFKSFEFESYNVASGEHVVKMEIVGCNVDYIDLSFSSIIE